MADERAQLAILGIDFKAPDADSDELRLSPVNGSPIGALCPRADELDSGYQPFADPGPEPYAALGAGGRAMSISPDGSIAAGAWQRASEAATGAAPAASIPPVHSTGQGAGAAPVAEKPVDAVPTVAAAAAVTPTVSESRCCSCSLASGCDDLLKCECRKRRAICTTNQCACRPGASHCTNYHVFAMEGASRVRKPAAGPDALPVRTASVTPSPRKKSTVQRAGSTVRPLPQAGGGVAPCVADSTARARSARSSLRFGSLTSPAGQTAMDRSVAQFDGAQSAAEVALLLLQPEVDEAAAAAVGAMTNRCAR